MPKRTTYNQIRLIVALSLLAALLAGAPAQARAAGAVICNSNSAGMNRAPRAQDSAPHQAGLVIDFGDGRVMTFCIDLGADDQATGEELLRASNLPVIFEYSGGIGGAVCKIDNVGSNFPAEPCFAHCTLQPGEPCMYWSYSQLIGDHWQFSQIGASGTLVHGGDVNGWAWGESTIARGAQPPLRTLADICQSATATPTASLTPTPTATATATLPPAAAPPATATPQVVLIIATALSSPTPTALPTPTSTPTTPSVVAPAVPTPSTPFGTAQGSNSGQGSAPAPAAPLTQLPAPSPPALTPQPPTATPSATPLPPTTSAVPAHTSLASLPTSAPANRSAAGNMRIQLPLIQHAVAAIPSTSTRPTARPESAGARPSSATPAPATATPTPTRQGVPVNDPTRNYPYFGGMTAFLIAGWALLRRGRARRVQ
jgi:hypothetical protein